MSLIELVNMFQFSEVRKESKNENVHKKLNKTNALLKSTFQTKLIQCYKLAIDAIKVCMYYFKEMHAKIFDMDMSYGSPCYSDNFPTLRALPLFYFYYSNSLVVLLYYCYIIILLILLSYVN